MTLVSTLLGILVGGTLALAGGGHNSTCTIHGETSTFHLSAPTGWVFVDCYSGIRDQHPNFYIVPEDPALAPSGPSDHHVVEMYGGPDESGTTVDGFLASDREVYSKSSAIMDGPTLNTADGTAVRVVHIASRLDRFWWAAHGYATCGATTFWLAFDCRRAEDCTAQYPAYEALVNSLRVVPNDSSEGR